jgi:V/A-type H+-transporting ATPase subunit I
MGLTPHSARWFRVLTVRQGAPAIAEALARTRVVQLETTTDAEPRSAASLHRDLAACERYAQRWARYWPRVRTMVDSAEPADGAVRRARAKMSAWARDAEPVVEALERAEDERAELGLLAELALSTAHDPRLDLDALAGAGPLLVARAWALERPDADVELPEHAIVRRVEGPERTFAVAVGPPEVIDATEAALAPARPRALGLSRLPEPGSATGGARSRIASRLEALDDRIARASAHLSALHRSHDIATAIHHFGRVKWFLDAVPRSSDTRHFAALTGWTSDLEGDVLRRALRRLRFPALLDFPPPPDQVDAPVVLTNPRWARPFEIFVRLLGTPGQGEADPSVLLAVLVPVIFGFMFGDVGQGAVVLALGLLLRRRFPSTRVLVPAGFAAMVFGVLFGSVFMIEHAIEATWLRPLEQPVTLLAVSVVGGAVVLVLGLLLRGVGAALVGELRGWLRSDAALVAVGVGLAGMALDLRLGALAAAGAVWYVVGDASRAKARRVSAHLAALGRFVESAFQLVVNAVSFARVGAFGLAHAGLSSAVHSLAHATGSAAGSTIVLVVGLRRGQGRERGGGHHRREARAVWTRDRPGRPRRRDRDLRAHRLDPDPQSPGVT